MSSALRAFLTNNISLLFCLGEFPNNVTVLTQKQGFFAYFNYNVILILVVYFYLLVLYGIKYLNLHLLYLLD